MDENRSQATDSPAGGADRLSLGRDDFVRSLTLEERTLLIVRDELYEGSWERMETDLQHRLTGKPYIFKLVNRIETDLANIQTLRAYEERHHLNLGPFVERK